MAQYLSKNDNYVFVTVGTTSFDDMIEAVLQEETLDVLKTKGFKKLLLQVGRGKDPCIPTHRHIDILWYRLKDSILEDMTSASLIISHAGAGSCIEALETGNPLVVVVNNKLMGNHQIELAGKLNNDGHAAMCFPQTLLGTIKILDTLAFKRIPLANPKNFQSYVERVMGFE